MCAAHSYTLLLFLLANALPIFVNKYNLVVMCYPKTKTKNELVIVANLFLKWWLSLLKNLFVAQLVIHKTCRGIVLDLFQSYWKVTLPAELLFNRFDLGYIYKKFKITQVKSCFTNLIIFRKTTFLCAAQYWLCVTYLCVLF